jgi:hypothetical protein
LFSVTVKEATVNSLIKEPELDKVIGVVAQLKSEQQEKQVRTTHFCILYNLLP